MDKFYIVAGDIHLERQQYGLPTRFEDNLKCVNFILNEVCKNPDCRGLILTGDNFHKKAILPKYQQLLASFYKQLTAAGKQMMAIDGNHDGSDASWLDTINPQLNVSDKNVLLSEKKARFYSFRLRPELYSHMGKDADSKFVFLHGRLLELLSWAKTQASPDYDFSAKEIRDLGFKDCTFLLGDLHTYGDYHDPVANNWFIYPGSTEMTELSEGNIISERFGDCYDTHKKVLILYPDRAVGKNWETMNLPNRPFLKRTIDKEEDIDLAISKLNEWIKNHPGGMLSLKYPQRFRANITPLLSEWKQQLLVLNDAYIAENNGKPLQEMQETDILDIAKKELSARQLSLLEVVLKQKEFSKEVLTLLAKPNEAIIA